MPPAMPPRGDMAVKTGEKAPEFDLEVTHDERVRLSELLRRSNVLLVFHPFAFTPVCEDEAREKPDETVRAVDRLRAANKASPR